MEGSDGTAGGEGGETRSVTRVELWSMTVGYGAAVALVLAWGGWRTLDYLPLYLVVASLWLGIGLTLTRLAGQPIRWRSSARPRARLLSCAMISWVAVFGGGMLRDVWPLDSRVVAGARYFEIARPDNALRGVVVLLALMMAAVIVGSLKRPRLMSGSRTEVRRLAIVGAHLPLAVVALVLALTPTAPDGLQVAGSLIVGHASQAWLMALTLWIVGLALWSGGLPIVLRLVDVLVLTFVLQRLVDDFAEPLFGVPLPPISGDQVAFGAVLVGWVVAALLAAITVVPPGLGEDRMAGLGLRVDRWWSGIVDELNPPGHAIGDPVGDPLSDHRLARGWGRSR